MAKKAVDKKPVVVKEKPAVVKPLEDLKAIEAEYNQLINGIKPKLLTKEQMKRGGFGIRARYEKEKGYKALMPKINELGKKLGKPPIGLGNLRR